MLNQWKNRVNYDLLKKKVTKLNKDIANEGIIRIKGVNLGGISPQLLTGYSYGEVYDWDLYFENIYMAYFGVSRFCRNNVEAFLDRQYPSGFVARTIAVPRYRQHFKPFLAQIVLLGIKQQENPLWLKDKYYDRLKAYLEYWFWNCDHDRNGLPVWDSADHTGMDNQNLRGGDLYSEYCEGVDLASYLYRELKAMAVIAEVLGEKDDIKTFEDHAEKLKETVNDVFWDEKDSFYYDRNEKTGELIRYKSASSLMPLWAGMCSEEQAKLLVEKHITNPEEFWLEYPLASWAKNEKGYYQIRKTKECTWMGASWTPINYMIMKGLMDYGYTDVAKELAIKNYDMVMGENQIREYYNAETGIGQGLNPFWGWSSLGLFMPFELSENYNPTALNTDKISALGTDLLGIEFE